MKSNKIELNIEKEKLNNNALYLFFKRLFDICVSFIAGIILLIPIAVIAVMIRIDSPGPAIFNQERLGKNGQKFIIHKFRTMKLDAEADGPKWAEINDVRCTKLGKVLRSSRLDELPQLWNIFIGEMSFVGPRPERECFYNEFETYIHGFSNRLDVKPGLTGLAQVNGGYNLPPEKKIIYDMKYIREQSFRLDIKCIIKTFKLLKTHEGAR